MLNSMHKYCKKFILKILKHINRSKFKTFIEFFNNPRLLFLEYEIGTSKKKTNLSQNFYKEKLSFFLENDHDEILGDSQWNSIFNIFHLNILNLVKEDNSKFNEVMDNPEEYNLFYGFDGNCKELKQNLKLRNNREEKLLIAQKILSISEYFGILRLDSGENFKNNFKRLNVNNLISKIEKKIRIKLKFHNPFPGEEGIVTNRGIISLREVEAIYQAYRIKIFLDQNKTKSKILEIGGGLGRTAYYCYRLGLKNYTLVDLKIPLLSQSNYLSRLCGENNIMLGGNIKNRIKNSKKIKLISPKELFDSNEKFDLVFNSDSLTEIDYKNQKKYINFIKKNSKTFYSINHEKNKHTVFNLMKYFSSKNKFIYNKSIYWMRKGYLEEIFKFN